MSRHVRWFILALSCTLFDRTDCCFAQDRGRGATEDTDATQSRAASDRKQNRAGLRAVTQLFGATIRLRDDEAFGTVDELLLDDTGRIVLLVTEFDGEFVPIPFEAVSLARLSDGYVFADLSRNVLLDAPHGRTLSSFSDFRMQYRVESFFQDRVGRMRRDRLADSAMRLNERISSQGELDRDRLDRREMRTNDRRGGIGKTNTRSSLNDRVDTASERSQFDLELRREKSLQDQDRGFGNRPSFDSRSRGIDLDSLRGSDSLSAPGRGGSRSPSGSALPSRSGTTSPGGSPLNGSSGRP